MSSRGAIVLLLASAWADGAEALLHVSGVGNAPQRALLATRDDRPAEEVEVRDGHLGRPMKVVADGEATLTLLNDDGTPILRPLRFRTPKSGGREVLIVSPGLPSGARVTVLPFDFTSHPKGAVAFLNLSDNPVRCWLGDRRVEVKPGGSVLHPLEGEGRRVVNHRVEYLDAAGKWTHDSSTTLILSAGGRFIFTLGPGRAEDGPLLRHNVTDYRPETNALPEPRISPAEPPRPQDPPAK